MALNSITSIFNGIFAELSRGFSALFAERNLRYVGLAAMLVVVGLVSWWGYSSYAAHREKSAHLAFAQIMEEVARGKQNKDINWADIAAQCKAAYAQHSSTSIAVYLLAFQADAFMNMGNKQEALTVLDTMLSRLSSRNPLYNVYRIKQALVRLDMSDEAVRAQGLTALQEMAADKNNVNRDEALFYLGSYYWSVQETEKAKSAWLDLIEEFKKGGQANSPYAQLAQERLLQIS